MGRNFELIDKMGASVAKSTMYTHSFRLQLHKIISNVILALFLNGINNLWAKRYCTELIFLLITSSCCFWHLSLEGDKAHFLIVNFLGNIIVLYTEKTSYALSDPTPKEKVCPFQMKTTGFDSCSRRHIYNWISAWPWDRSSERFWPYLLCSFLCPSQKGSCTLPLFFQENVVGNSSISSEFWRDNSV
jgi:hypothetical protein